MPDSRGGASQRRAFRYILALMLARKKMLVFEGKKKDAAGAELHLFRERRGGQIHPVHEPALSPDEVAAVSAELGVLLGLTPPAAPVRDGRDARATPPAAGETLALRAAPAEAQTAGGAVAATTGGTT